MRRSYVLVLAVVATSAACGAPRTPQPKFSQSAYMAAIRRPAATLPAENVELPRTVDARMARVDGALNRMAGLVRTQSHPEALRRAFAAYYSYRAAHPQQVRKPYLYYVDFGLDSRTPRGYVFDMEALTVVDGPFTVAHGRGSDRNRDGMPSRFSNLPGSNATSLGLFLAQETYSFHGKSGGRAYRSIGLRMKGVSGIFNNAARDRGVVVHGAPYVTPDRAGRSEGCPAVEQERAERLIPMIANGGLVYLYSPRDQNWLREDPWTRGLFSRSLLSSRG